MNGVTFEGEGKCISIDMLKVNFSHSIYSANLNSDFTLLFLACEGGQLTIMWQQIPTSYNISLMDIRIKREEKIVSIVVEVFCKLLIPFVIPERTEYLKIESTKHRDTKTQEY